MLIPLILTGIAYSIGNSALIKAEFGRLEEAEAELWKSIELLEKMEDNFAISDYYVRLGDIFLKKLNYQQAFDLVNKGLVIASANGYTEQIRDAHEILCTINIELNNYEQALFHQAQYMIYKDSIVNADLIRKMANLRTEYEVGQKQTEIDILEIQRQNQRNILIGLGILLGIAVIASLIIWNFYREKDILTQKLEAQKNELNELNSTKDKIFSIISHDLRGPMAAFQGVSRMIEFAVSNKKSDQLLAVTNAHVQPKQNDGQNQDAIVLCSKSQSQC